MRGWLPAAGALILLPGFLAPPAGGAGGDEGKPLPTGKTQALIAQEPSLYTVEGRVRIPKGVELTVMRNTRIVGKGSSPAVIEVEGGFDCIGVFSREVILENVTVEPCESFERIHMDMAEFRGSGGIRTPKDTPVDGSILVENFDMTGQAAMDVTFKTGKVTLSSVCADNPTRIRCVPPAGKDRDQVKVFIRGCDQNPRHKCTPHGGRVGLVGGLEVHGGDDVTIQLSRIGGSLCSVRDWGQRLIFDGNKVNSGKLEFSHVKAGQYQRVQCANCDVYSSEVSVSAPPDPKVKDMFTMDRIWFKGIADPKEVQEKVIRDGADAPDKNGARVALMKVEERPHELAGPVDR
jgi:hypothetical protein